MKATKKYPSKQLERYSTVFMQIGLVLTLTIVLVVLESEKSSVRLHSIIEPPLEYSPTIIDFPIHFVKEVPVENLKKEVVKPPILLDEINKIKDNEPNLIEQKNELVDTKQHIKNALDQLIDVDSVIDVIETLPMSFIQSAPIFQGCEGLTEKEGRACFDQKLKQTINTHFNSNLLDRLGLFSGKHKIVSQFLINTEGDIVEIKVRASTISLKNETIKLLQALPKFTPGKHNLKAVNVRYTLPLTFHIE